MVSRVEPDHRERRLAQPPGAALAAVGEAAEMWGAAWRPGSRGGELELPVVAGVRRGVLSARIDVASSPPGSRLSVSVGEESWRVHRQAVTILALGGLGGLSLVFWPFFPRLLALAPIGVVLALAAWLLVVGRLQTSGVDDFLDVVEELADGGGEGDGDGDRDARESSAGRARYPG